MQIQMVRWMLEGGRRDQSCPEHTGAAPEIFGRLTDLLPHNDQDYVRAGGPAPATVKRAERLFRTYAGIELLTAGRTGS